MSNIPTKLSLRSFQSLVLLLDKCNVCPGNPDKHLVEVGLSKKGKFLFRDEKKVTARVDNYSKVCLNSEQYDATLRSTDCELVVQGSKCTSCVAYHNLLRRMYHR